MLTGRCECGAIRYRLAGPAREVIACHCSQCRRTSGHFWAATSVASDDLVLTHDAGLTWFRSSDVARRGFCSLCGSSLFYEMDGEGRVSIGAGTLDGQTGLTTGRHIFAADKGDYYEIGDGLPQSEGA